MLNLLRLLIVLLAFVTFLGCKPTLAQEAKSQKHILYISSYSNSWATVPSQMAGLKEALGEDYVLHYEYMDTKRTIYHENYREFYDFLKLKLASGNIYEGIVVADDAALGFFKLYQKELFPKVKATFTSVDNIENGKKAAEQDWMTGVIEAVDYKKNIELAKLINPKAKRINIIVDNMENGAGIIQQLLSEKEIFAGRELLVVNSSEYTKDEFKEKLSSFTEEDIVFCGTLGQSRGGILYTESERNEYIRDYVKVPVLCATEMGVGQGYLGGYVVDHRESTKRAGLMLRQMLEQGTKPKLELNTPHVYLFDYKLLKKFNISEGKLREIAGEGIIFLNKPLTFKEKYYNQIILGLLMALSGVAILLMFMKHKQNKQLQEKNEHLEQALLQAKVAGQAKQSFLSRMSHDVRTPINGIIGLLEMEKKEKDNPEALEVLRSKERAAAEQLLSLFNDLLDMSRIEDGDVQLVNESISLMDLMEEVADLAKVKAVAAEIKLETDLSSGVFDNVFVNTSPEHFRQIFNNIIGNAIKFTKAGGQVSCRAEILEEDDQHITYKFTISDNGIGMSKEFLEHIFEPFTQAEEGARTNYKGTGLGMTIVKGLLKEMGGSIAVTSEPEVGSSVVITLPFTLAAAKDLYVNSKETEDFSPIAGMKILLVEDNELNMEIAQFMLQELGAEVEEAWDGKEAVELYKSKPAFTYDLVLMDLMMPHMDGYEATKQIRQSGREDALSLPVLAISANTLPEDIRASREAGMNEHLGKPVELRTLAKALLKFKKL